MTTNLNMFYRKSLDEICTVPDDIISVYIVERHIWADDSSNEARKSRKAELKTIEEFLINPVRPFLNSIFMHLAAPYDPNRRDVTIGKGYWIQAEFGSGKSHVLSFIGALALGNREAWELINHKEKEVGKAKRDSLYIHWENGLKKKSQGKGILVVVKTLVGVGSSTVDTSDIGPTLVESILDAIQEQYRMENNRPIPLFPTELLLRRFLNEDLERYRRDLDKFLSDPNYFDVEATSTIDEFLSKIQNSNDSGIQKDCGRKLWQFYEDYLKVKPKIPISTEEILKHAVITIMEDGYEGLLLILDEVSLYMQNRTENQRTDDVKTLDVLSKTLVHNFNLPVWTICAAQQAIESRAAAKNIIAKERLELIPLLNDERSYYDIALSRVRTIIDKSDIAPYYEDYKKAFTWPEAIGKDEFERFFPFYPPSIDIVRAVSYGLTTVRSALYFMLQALKTARKNNSRELITLWSLFDDVVRYEEDPSGTTQGITSIKTKWETEWRAYEAARRQLGLVTKGEIKRWLPRCEKILKTLYLYYVARMFVEGLNVEEIMNCVMEWRDHDEDQKCDKTDNLAHYEILLNKVDLELVQVGTTDRGYVFSPIRMGIDWNDVYRKARSDAEQSRIKQDETWRFLLELNGWVIQSSHETRDLFDGHRSVFWRAATDGKQLIKVDWRKREVQGSVFIRNLLDMSKNRTSPIPLDTPSTDEDFAIYVSDRSCESELDRLCNLQKDARVMFWSPAEPTASENEILLDLTAFRTLVKDYKDQSTQDARTIIDQVQGKIRDSIGKISKIVPDRYARGRLCATDHNSLPNTMRDELSVVFQKAVATVLDAVYISSDLDLSAAPSSFSDDEAIKVINGIVRTGEIPRNAKPDKNISAVQNYGVYLGIVKRGAEKKLDTSASLYVDDLYTWVSTKIRETGHPIPILAVYKNFMGVGGPGGKNYGLSKRLIDLFLLCQVREARVRISIDPRQVEGGFIDYSNIERIDFKKAILQTMKDISLMEAPEGWDVLRPFAAILLDDPHVEEVIKDVEIQDAMRRLLNLLNQWSSEINELGDNLTEIFTTISQDNPISDRFDSWGQFVQADIDANRPVPHLLNALDHSFGYRAFADMQSHPEEHDDLASRKREIENVHEFVKRRREIVAAFRYSQLIIEEQPLKDEIKPYLKRLRKSMGQFPLLLADPAKTIADLIEPFQHLRTTYETRYMQVFDEVVNRSEKVRSYVAELSNGKIAKALTALNQVKALEKTDLNALADKGIAMLSMLFPSELRSADVRVQLKDTPFPTGSGNLISDVNNWLEKANEVRLKCETVYHSQLFHRAHVLNSPNMRSLLEQGKNESFIDKILATNDENDLATVLVEELSIDPAMVKLLEKYLKKIRVKKVNLSEFHPDVKTIGPDELDQVVSAFRIFLEEQLIKQSEDESIVIVFE